MFLGGRGGAYVQDVLGELILSDLRSVIFEGPGRNVTYSLNKNSG